MKVVLITGAGGFVGRRVVPLLLERGFEVHATTHRFDEALSKTDPRVALHPIDLLGSGERIENLVAELKPSHLLHLAWDTTPGDYWTSHVNLAWVEASLRLVRSFVASGGRRVVCAGTCAEYDWSGGRCSERETPLRPASLYGVSKNSLREMLEAFATQAGFSFAWGRVFFPYGPGEHRSRLVSSIALALLRGERAVCRKAAAARDFIHVDDVARAFGALLDCNVTGAVNIASGEATSIGNIARRIADEVKRGDLLECSTVENEKFPVVVADIARLKSEVGFLPTIGVQEGLHSTIEACRSTILLGTAGSSR